MKLTFQWGHNHEMNNQVHQAVQRAVEKKKAGKGLESGGGKDSVEGGIWVETWGKSEKGLWEKH